MQSLVVFLAVAAVARASLPLAQPAHHPAVVLDAHGRPLDTAEVIGARAVHLQAKALEPHGHLAHAAIAAPIAHAAIAPAVIAAPAAVSHQSRVDVRHSPAIISHAVAAPVIAAHPSVSVWGAHSAHASPLLGHGHLLGKRSLGLWGSHAAPIAHSVVVSAPAHAVSHQSRVDVHSSPAIVSHAVAAPVISHVAAPVVAHALPAAVSHQSRVHVHSSPSVVSHSVLAAPLIHSAPLAHSAGVYGYGHGVHGY